jgi:hypothetical protein
LRVSRTRCDFILLLGVFILEFIFFGFILLRSGGEHRETGDVSSSRCSSSRKRKEDDCYAGASDALTDSEEEVLTKPNARKKIRQKLTVITREGHSLDRFFPTISLIVLRVHILSNQECADDFAQVLVHSERRHGVPRVVAPDISDRAHDSFKWMAIY